MTCCNGTHLVGVLLFSNDVVFTCFFPALYPSDCLLHTWTGTNFLVRSNALLEVGGSPQYTLTEDFALGMEMKKYGWHCRYVQEYLAIGEAPDQIRNCYQQRSRWCKVCARTHEMTNSQMSHQTMSSRWCMSLYAAIRSEFYQFSCCHGQRNDAASSCLSVLICIKHEHT